MQELPPLDELAARKRLIQIKMELHRAEMALYTHQLLSPLRTAQLRVTSLFSHPITRYVTVGAVGLLVFTRRLKVFRKVGGFVAPLILPFLRRFLFRQIGNLVMRGVRR